MVNVFRNLDLILYLVHENDWLIALSNDVTTCLPLSIQLSNANLRKHETLENVQQLLQQ